MRGQEEACVFASKPIADGFDFFWSGRLLGNEVVESKHHQSVSVGQYPLVDRQPVARLIDALEHGDRMAGDVFGNLLEAESRTVKQLERARDSLEKLRRAPFRLLVGRPGDAANLRHRRKPVVHLRKVALGLPRVAPGPIDADAPLARRVFAGDMVLVVGARSARCAHGKSSRSVFIPALASLRRAKPGIEAPLSPEGRNRCEFRGNPAGDSDLMSATVPI